LNQTINQNNLYRSKCSRKITAQHGSADTVVRAMSVKYKKWRLGGSCNSETI